MSQEMEQAKAVDDPNPVTWIYCTRTVSARHQVTDGASAPGVLLNSRADGSDYIWASGCRNGMAPSFGKTDERFPDTIDSANRIHNVENLML